MVGAKSFLCHAVRSEHEAAGRLKWNDRLMCRAAPASSTVRWRVRGRDGRTLPKPTSYQVRGGVTKGLQPRRTDEQDTGVLREEIGAGVVRGISRSSNSLLGVEVSRLANIKTK